MDKPAQGLQPLEIAEAMPEEMVPEDLPEVEVMAAPPRSRGRKPRAVDSGTAAAETVPFPSPEIEKTVAQSFSENRVSDGSRSTPPNIDEWKEFIGGKVLRLATDGYLSLMLKDFEDDLTPRERKQIELTKEDLKDMAAPLAIQSNKSKFMRKHGRSMIAAADSYEAVIALVIWMRRVRRISRKYAIQRAQTPPGHLRTMQMDLADDGTYQARPVNEGFGNGNSGINHEQGAPGRQPQPPAGPLFNPGIG